MSIQTRLNLDQLGRRKVIRNGHHKRGSKMANKVGLKVGRIIKLQIKFKHAQLITYDLTNDFDHFFHSFLVPCICLSSFFFWTIVFVFLFHISSPILWFTKKFTTTVGVHSRWMVLWPKTIKDHKEINHLNFNWHKEPNSAGPCINNCYTLDQGSFCIVIMI